MYLNIVLKLIFDKKQNKQRNKQQQQKTKPILSKRLDPWECKRESQVMRRTTVQETSPPHQLRVGE